MKNRKDYMVVQEINEKFHLPIRNSICFLKRQQFPWENRVKKFY